MSQTDLKRALNLVTFVWDAVSVLVLGLCKKLCSYQPTDGTV